MLSAQLLDAIQQLDKTEKLRVVQILVNDLAQDELPETTKQQMTGKHEIWSPLASDSAALVLQNALNEYKKHV